MTDPPGTGAGNGFMPAARRNCTGGVSIICHPVPAEFYLQTVDTVFVKDALPNGEMRHRGALVDLSVIRRVGLLTVEGEKATAMAIDRLMILCEFSFH